MSIQLKPRTLKDGSSWPPFEIETVFAETIGDGEYRVANIPFYADCVNFGDVVSARKDSRSELLHFESVVRRSGRATVRIILIDELGEPDAERAVDIVEKYGCEWESGGGVVAADVPPSVDLNSLNRELRPFGSNKYVEIEVVPSGP